MAIQVRRGNESDFDASKMLPGEWAVSLDTKYVRMCFAPGVVLRMATYEGFEADKAQFQAILAECKSIQSAVQRIQAEVNSKASLVVEYSNNAKTSADKAHSEAERAKIYADNAEAVTGVQIATKERAGLIKGGDNYIAEDGTLMLITTTTSTTQPNSYAGRENILEIGGVTEQDSTAGKNFWTFGDIKIGASTNLEWNIPAGTYTFSCSNSAPALLIRVFYTDESNELISLDKAVTTFTLNKDVYKFNFSTSSAGDITNIQVEAGTVATPYEPYTGGQPAPNPSYPMEIKKTVVSGVKTHGKNFFAFGNTAIDVTAELRKNSAQRLTLSSVDGNPNKLKCNFVGGNYSTGYIAINGVDGTKDWAISYDIESNTTEYTPDMKKDKTNSNTERLVLVIGGGNGGTSVGSSQYFVLSNIQVEEGTVATEYEPYTESSATLSQPIELYGMNDVQDVIDVKARVVRRRTKAKTISNVTLMDSQGLLGGIALEDNVVDYNGSNIMCDSFNEFDYVGGLRQKDYGLTIYNKYLYIRNADVEQTVSGYTEWLASNPITVVYELATPTTEALPIADQIALNSLQTYDGITYVEFDSEIQPTFKGEYGTSKVGGYTLESLLTARNNELKQNMVNERLSALETSVVNNI